MEPSARAAKVAATRFPVAAAAGFDDVRPPSLSADRITPTLAALQVYQLSLEAPRAPSHLYRGEAARRGRALFVGKADCARCHVPPLYTEPGHNLHPPEEIGIDSFQADRGPTGQYRTTPLKGLWSHARGGYYHDGRFATLDAVVVHYDQHFDLGLSADEQSDLVEFLKSL
jgi:cytochrome c peroxidase